MTWRIGSTAGLASSRYASHRHVSRPLLASRAGGATWSLANCSAFQYVNPARRVGFFFSSAFLAASIFGSLASSGIESNFTFHLASLTSSSCASAKTCPSVSNCGRPARPNICCALLGSISFFLSRGPLTSVVRMTDLAGRLMPAASVSVQTQTLSSFSWNSISTTRR